MYKNVGFRSRAHNIVPTTCDPAFGQIFDNQFPALYTATTSRQNRAGQQLNTGEDSKKAPPHPHQTVQRNESAMYVLRSRSVGFVALSSALALISGAAVLGVEQGSGGSAAAAAPFVDDVGVVASKAQPTARKLAESCLGAFIGDGDCDVVNNTEDCGK